MKISARNMFAGTVSKVAKGAVNTEVDLTLKDGEKIAAIITNDSVESLGLKEGKAAYAIVKSNWVIIGKDLHKVKMSTRNILCGSITKLAQGAVNTEVALKLAGGSALTAIITNESTKALELKEGEHACAAFKASSVIIATE
ncbi:MAG TPA: TOBE domain-containing protein [Desulfuromonadaceae bacterium]|jgi:molybdate transport system regulatory protein